VISRQVHGDAGEAATTPDLQLHPSASSTTVVVGATAGVIRNARRPARRRPAGRWRVDDGADDVT